MNSSKIDMLKQYHIGSLDHMTHIDNLESILKYGLLAHSNPHKTRDISNTEVNARRNKREPIYNRNIHDYVPFYFNPRNAMMYRNKNEDIVVLAFSQKLIFENNTIFTNKNASADSVNFFNSTQQLDKLEWNYVWSDSWNTKPNVTEVKQAMMAEVLVYSQVPINNLIGVYAKNETMKKHLIQSYNLPANKIKINANMFFA